MFARRHRPGIEAGVIDADFVSGKEEALEKVSSFLDKIDRSAEIEGDVKLLLSQLGGGTARAIQDFLFQPGEDNQVVEVADEIVARALDDGQALGSGRVRYALSVDGHRGRCGFNLTFPESDEEDIDFTPDETGALAQTMKHNEVLMRFTKDVFKETLRDHRQNMQEMRTEVANLRRGQVDNIKLFAELHDAKFANEIELKKIAQGEARKEEILGVLTQGIPAVMNRFLGPGTVKDAVSPIEQMLVGFLGTLTQEQFETMMKSGNIPLRTEQIYGLLEIYKAAQEKQAARQPQADTPSAANPQDPQASPSPSK